MPESGVKSSAQLKCMYINAQSVGNKQEEQEAIVQQENYAIVTNTERWWDSLHDWSGPMDGYLLFRRDRTRKGRWWGFRILGRLLTV